MIRLGTTALMLFLISALHADAKGRFSTGELPTPEPPAPAVLKRAGFDQKLGEQVDLSLTFSDESGRKATLSEFAAGKPVLLNLVYFGCPMLCTEVANGVMESVGEIPYDIGRDYVILTVSFDDKEGPDDARGKKDNYLKALNRPGAEKGWHFLTGDASVIESLTKSVGFSFAWDESSKQYGHASGIVILTPTGKISHYFYGVRYPTKDVRLALADASEGKIGGPVEKLLLFCFHYDASAGKYSMAVRKVLQAGGIVTMCAIGLLVIPALRSRKQPARPVVEGDASRP